jgi:hypothetical protein
VLATCDPWKVRDALTSVWGFRPIDLIRPMLAPGKSQLSEHDFAIGLKKRFPELFADATDDDIAATFRWFDEDGSDSVDILEVDLVIRSLKKEQPGASDLAEDGAPQADASGGANGMPNAIECTQEHSLQTTRTALLGADKLDTGVRNACTTALESVRRNTAKLEAAYSDQSLRLEKLRVSLAHEKSLECLHHAVEVGLMHLMQQLGAAERAQRGGSTEQPHGPVSMPAEQRVPVLRGRYPPKRPATVLRTPEASHGRASFIHRWKSAESARIVSC